MKELKLSDDTIGHIAKILQVALLTGTDVVDNLRMVRVADTDEGVLIPHPDYLDRFEKTLEEMITEDAISQMKQTLQDSVDGGWLTPEQEAAFVEGIEDPTSSNFANFIAETQEKNQVNEVDENEEVIEDEQDPDDELDNVDDLEDVDEW